MKLKRDLLLTAILALAAALPAQKLIITPTHVAVGTVLHFSAVMDDKLGDCTVNPGQHGPLYVSNDGGSWQSEGIVPVHNSGTQTYNFSKTYTVTAADLDNPDFCFLLCRPASGCWVQAACFDETRACPQTKIVIPPFRLRKYLECSPIPGCPACLMLDLRELIQSIGDPAVMVQVVLLRNGRQVALLGEAGRGRQLPAQARITLPAAERRLSNLQPLAGFQLQLLGARGRVLASQEIQLKLK